MKKRVLTILISAAVILVSCTNTVPGTDTPVSEIETPVQPNIPVQTEIPSNAQSANIYFLSVGNADCVFIDIGEFEILIDGGERGDGDYIIDRISPYVDGKIDIVTATHAHADHIGGLDTVIDRFGADIIIDSGDTSDSVQYKEYMASSISSGAQFIYDDDMVFNIGNDISYKIIECGDGYSNSNDNSVVSQLNVGEKKFLFTGDIESHIEKKYLQKFEDIDVLKVAHHGSDTSTSQEFLDIVKPEYAVISCGKGNRYGHPSIAVLERLSDINLYRTDEVGDILIICDIFGMLTVKTGI